jgi:hypothetical protein
MRALCCISLLLLSWANVVIARNVLYAVTAPADGRTSRLLVISNYATEPIAIDLGETGHQLLDVGVDPTSCRIFAVGYDGRTGFYELSSANGVARFIGELAGFAPPNALEFDRSGQAYAWNPSWQFLKINKTVGTGSLVGLAGPSSGGDLAFDVDGTLYGAAYGYLVRINPTNGTSTIIGPFDIEGVYGLEIDTDGTMYASSTRNQFELYRINKSDATSTLIGPVRMAGAFDPVSYSYTNAPAPAINGLAFLVPAEPALPPTLSITRELPNVRLSWSCDCARDYQLLSTPQLDAPFWNDLGILVTRTSGITNLLAPAADSASFFRLRIPAD